MLTAENFHIGDVVSFNFYPSAILGQGYTNAKVLAVLDMGTAALYIDPPAMHANVYATLPQEVPDNPASYAYLKLLLANGQTTVVGIPWIIDASLQVASVNSVQFTVANISASDKNKIVLALAAIGFTAVSMKDLPQG